MNRRLFAALLVIMLTTGCQAMIYGTGSDLNKLSIGMTKAEVIHHLGNPTSLGADGTKGEEYLDYRKMSRVIEWSPSTYRVIIRDGKVTSYGQLAY